MFQNLICKIRYALENSYFHRKYAKLPPQIYFDRKYDTFVHPKLISERGCGEYVCGELTKSGCIYHFYLGAERNHEHTISEVFLKAYNHSKQFSISENDEAEYSRQELNLIRKLVKQGINDRHMMA